MPIDRLDGLTVRDLRSLVVLGEVRSFTQTAELLSISQPSLSAAVKQAEAALGVCLFRRTSRRCDLTAEGEAAIRNIREALARLGALVDHPGDGPSAPLRLGMIPTVGPYLWPAVAGRLRQAIPDAEIRLAEATTPRLQKMLHEGRLDVAVVSFPLTDDRLEYLPLFQEDLLLAVPEDHPLAGRASVRPDEVDDSSLLLLEHGHCLRDQVIAACGAREATAQTVHATSIQTVLHMVQAGIGGTIVPAMAATERHRLPDTAYVPFSPSPHREIGLAYVPWIARRSVLDALAAALRHEA